MVSVDPPSHTNGSEVARCVVSHGLSGPTFLPAPATGTSVPFDGTEKVSPNPLASLGGTAETSDPGVLEAERKKSKKRSVRFSPVKAKVGSMPEVGPDGELILPELDSTPHAQLPFVMEDGDELT